MVRHPVAREPAAARNSGLREATTPFVAFLDSDVVPGAGWLEQLRPHLDDPRVAVVAPRIVALADGGSAWLSSYEAAVSALDMGAGPAPVRPLSAVAYVPSAALLTRRAALGPGFDEAMRVAEDVDLVRRLAARHGSAVAPVVLALLAVAAADGAVAWWPHRGRVGPVRFVLARRAEDLAYGAGLWEGALRARDLRALLPARPPRS